MTPAEELAELFRRDLTRLIEELKAFTDPAALWQTCPGISNSAGTLALHLEGNLREFIGRQLGGVPYTRQRDAEFTTTGVPLEQLTERVEDVLRLVSEVLGRLDDGVIEAAFPQPMFGRTLSSRQLLIHLYGHLTWHLGQIDYLRRFLGNGAAIPPASL